MPLRPAYALLVATLANLPATYVLVDATRGPSLALPVLAVGGVSMAQAWAAGSLLERRREPHRRVLTWLVVAGTVLELPVMLTLRALGLLPRTGSDVLAFAAVASVAGLAAAGLLLARRADGERPATAA